MRDRDRDRERDRDGRGNHDRINSVVSVLLYVLMLLECNFLTVKRNNPLTVCDALRFEWPRIFVLLHQLFSDSLAQERGEGAAGEGG